MIRIHRGTMSRCFTLATQSTYVFYNAGNLGLQLLMLDIPNHAVEDFRSFDEIYEDPLGDNISYGNPKICEHHWNSIVNWQVKGDIYAFDTARFVLDFRTLNLLTQNNDFRLVHVIYGQRGGLVYDILHYTKPTEPTTNRRLAMYAGIVATPFKFERGYHYDVFDLRRDVYEDRIDGFRTFHPYSHGIGEGYTFITQQPTIGLTFHSWSNREHNWVVEVKVKYILYADEGPQQWVARRREAIELALTSGSLRIYWTGWGGAEQALPVDVVLHRPYYEALFPQTSRNPNWGALAAEAYQSLHFSDINGIAYIADTLEMGAAFSSFAKTLKSLPTRRVKAAASAWLSIHYGFKLALLDTISLSNEIEKQSLRNARMTKCQSSLRYSHGNVSYVARYQVFYDEFAKLNSYLKQLLQISDLWLTSENLWDMVPYSFVIDWFVSIGDVLSAIDGYARLQQSHDVICSGKSIKGECAATPSMLGLDPRVLTSECSITAYFRRYSRFLQLPTFLPTVTLQPFNHLIEAAALVISR